MRLLGHCVRLPRSIHDIQTLRSGTCRASPPRHINSGFSTAVKRQPARRKWASYIIVLTATVGGVTYSQYGPSSSTDVLNPQRFTPFQLVSKEPVSSTCSIFTFRGRNGPRSESFDKTLWNSGICSVQIKQPQLQIARAYTPLPPLQAPSAGVLEGDEELRFLIRKEPKGEVSGYLHNLPDGAAVEFRGPNIEYMLPNDVEEVVFLAGGTGIAPALQIAHSLLEAPTESVVDTKPRVHVLWACRKREDCLGGLGESQGQQKTTTGSMWSTMLSSSGTAPAEHDSTRAIRQGQIVEELEAFKTRHPGQISVDYFVDEEKRFIGVDKIRTLITPGASQSPTALYASENRPKGKKLILVSGPVGFVDYYAGPKKWEGGKEVQGELGGSLAGFNLHGWQVWKL